MGIYDREYIRREGSGFLSSFTDRGKATKWLIGANVVIFLLQLIVQPTGGHGLTEALWLDLDHVKSGEIWRLLSYAFIHDPGQIMHILFNMLFLYWLGAEVEELYGTKEFLAFYFSAAVLGGFGFLLWETSQHLDNPCLGASGAVTAVMVLYALHFPSRQIYLWFLIPIPIWLFVGFQVLQDTFGLLGGGGSNTAFSVHLVGAAFAFIYYKGQCRFMNVWTSIKSWQKGYSRPRLRVYSEDRSREPISMAPTAAPDIDEQMEAKLDAVLEKVARTGQESLSDSEKQILLRASEVYKRRRT